MVLGSLTYLPVRSTAAQSCLGVAFSRFERVLLLSAKIKELILIAVKKKDP